MQFYVHKIQSPPLKGLVEYILFNHNDCSSTEKTITSYANTNICLGIVKEKKLVEQQNGTKGLKQGAFINAYLSGLYLRPHHFELKGILDEICIDFTPIGYHHFFKYPLPTYLLETEVLTTVFGPTAIDVFTTIFGEQNFHKRGLLIEQFLLKCLKEFENNFLKNSLHLIHQHQGNISLKRLNELLQCSEKRLIRAFKNHFHLSPKTYLQIVKFRTALRKIHFATAQNLTQIGYESGYYDQSHFIKSFQYFTNNSPRALRKSLQNVQQEVIIGIE